MHFVVNADVGVPCTPCCACVVCLCVLYLCRWVCVWGAVCNSCGCPRSQAHGWHLLREQVMTVSDAFALGPSWGYVTLLLRAGVMSRSCSELTAYGSPRDVEHHHSLHHTSNRAFSGLGVCPPTVNRANANANVRVGTLKRQLKANTAMAAEQFGMVQGTFCWELPRPACLPSWPCMAIGHKGMVLV